MVGGISGLMIEDDYRIVFSCLLGLEEIMLFHVTTQHSWETCRGRLREGLAPNSQPPSEMSRWVEGNDDVKVLCAWEYQSSHRCYALVEAAEYDSVVQLFNPRVRLMWVGDVDILPVNDMISRRKDSGDWGN